MADDLLHLDDSTIEVTPVKASASGTDLIKPVEASEATPSTASDIKTSTPAEEEELEAVRKSSKELQDQILNDFDPLASERYASTLFYLYL